MSEDDLAGLYEDHRVNAILAWVLVVVIGASVVTEVTTGDLPSAAFALVVGVIAVLPAFHYRNPRIMMPWEVIALAALPVLGRVVAQLPITEALATYLAVAAVALMIAVELHAFTRIRMTLGFAFVSVIVFTTAAAGAWAVIRWGAHLLLSTSFTLTNDELMIEFVYSIVAGFLAAIVFEFYIRRYANVDRLPPGVRVR